MSRSRERTEARSIQSELDVPYTLALRLLRTAREIDPTLRGTYLRNKCKEILEQERKRSAP